MMSCGTPPTPARNKKRRSLKRRSFRAKKKDGTEEEEETRAKRRPKKSAKEKQQQQQQGGVDSSSTPALSLAGLAANLPAMDEKERARAASMLPRDEREKLVLLCDIFAGRISGKEESASELIKDSEILFICLTRSKVQSLIIIEIIKTVYFIIRSDLIAGSNLSVVHLSGYHCR